MRKLSEIEVYKFKSAKQFIDAVQVMYINMTGIKVYGIYRMDDNSIQALVQIISPTKTRHSELKVAREYALLCFIDDKLSMDLTRYYRIEHWNDTTPSFIDEGYGRSMICGYAIPYETILDEYPYLKLNEPLDILKAILVKEFISIAPASLLLAHLQEQKDIMQSCLARLTK